MVRGHARNVETGRRRGKAESNVIKEEMEGTKAEGSYHSTRKIHAWGGSL